MKTCANSLCSRRGGILRSSLFILIFLVAAIGLVWMVFLPRIVTWQIHARSGFPARIASLSCNPFAGDLHLRGLEIDNPPQVREKPFVSVSRFDLSLAPNTVFGKRVVVHELILSVDKVTVVIGKDGRSNLELFEQNVSGPADQTKPPKSTQPAASESREFLIEHMHIHLAQVEIDDFRHNEASKRTIDVNLDRDFRNVSDPREIVGPILADLARSGVSQLVGKDLFRILPKQMSAPLEKALEDSGGVFKNSGEKTKAIIKNLFESISDKLKK